MRSPASRHPGSVFATVAGLVLGLGLGSAAAQPLPGVEDYAAAITTLTAPRWGGPRVPYPVESNRPIASIHGRSIDRRLAFHGTSRTRDDALEAATRGATRMHDALLNRGFDGPFPDGDLGGGPELDLYLVDDLEVPYAIASDGPRPFAYLDGILAHVVLDGSMASARLEACAAEAYASALLAELDPAESPHWRTSVATYLGWLLDGTFEGCTDATSLAQRAPYTGFTSFDGPGAGALFLAIQSLRSDSNDAHYIRDTWTMSRQRTWEGEDLRASPDVWEAIATTATLLDQTLDRYLVDAAVARIALGVPAMERSSSLLALSGLGPSYAIPYAFVGSFGALPIRTAPHAPALAATGSAYARVDVTTASARDRLRIFLRGEASVRWSLVALSLDADGRAIGRVEAPIRERAWDAYVTVEIGRAKSVVVIVTNLGAARPDADAVRYDDRTFHLLIDHASDG